jgi:proteasome accessory factor A
MSETTMLLKVGATDLVLRMVEAGTVLRDLTLENPIRAIRDVSHDMTGRRKIRLANGRELSALEIQHEYLAKARSFVDGRGGDKTTERVLELWERSVRAVETGNLDLIARDIDWVTKYQLIERYRSKHDLPLASPRVAQLDLAYHDVHRGAACTTCCSARGRSSGYAATGVFEAKSIRRGPGRGRARFHQARLRDFYRRLGAPEAQRPAQRTVLCKDPFRSVGEQVSSSRHGDASSRLHSAGHRPGAHLLTACMNVTFITGFGMDGA